jgi:hypothetical protein
LQAAAASLFNALRKDSFMTRTIRRVEPVAAFLAGSFAVAGLYRAYGWWLNSGREVLRTSLVLLALGLFVAVWRRESPWCRAVALWAGASAAMIVALFLAGPGTIWPIVLLFAGGIAAAAVFGGTVTGVALMKMATLTRGQTGRNRNS